MDTRLLIILVVIFFTYMSYLEGLWGKGKAARKASNDMKSIRNFKRKEELTYKLLRICEWFANNYGLKPSKYQLDEYYYRIERLRLRINILSRTIKPLELVGIIKLTSLSIMFMGLCTFIMTGQALSLVCLMALFIDKAVHATMSIIINERDKKLEEDFPLFYMMIYPRLLKGTKGRITPILKEYLDITNTAKAQKQKKIIREYVEELKMKIDLYNDDTVALIKAREIYNSAMIVNFTNLAVQSLRGVDNADRLVTFKIELQNKENELMEKRAKAIIRKAEIVVWAIFLILFQVIIVTYSSRLTFLM